jgi:hypothetical protein
MCHTLFLYKDGREDVGVKGGGIETCPYIVLTREKKVRVEE